MSLKILQVCGTAEGGRWFLDQVTELLQRGHEVDVVLPAQGSLVDAFASIGVSVHVIPFRGYKPQDWPRLWRAQRRLSRLIRRGGYDVVHAHLLKSVVSARIACAVGTHPPLVSQVAGVVHLESLPLNLIDRVTSRFDSALVASCTNFADVYRARGVKHVYVSYYGCHVEIFSPDDAAREATRRVLGLQDGDVAIGMVAHMYPSGFKSFQEVGVKGHETFIDAAARVHRKANRSVRFYIVGDEFVGDGSYRRGLERRAEQLGLTGTLHFLGHRDDVRDVVAAMDLMVNPSLSESASYTMIESSLMEKPVVATRVGGLTDTVIDGVTGRLVPPRDEQALSEAMQFYLQHPDIGAEDGKRGREHVYRLFDIRSTVTSLESVYRQVVGHA